MGIRNTLGTYVKVARAMTQMQYMTYARIYIYMDVSKAIPESITLSYEDYEWEQNLDYKYIPFNAGVATNMAISIGIAL